MSPRFPYYNPELSRSDVEPHSSELYEAIELLEDPMLQSEIEAGNITFAMIRPAVGPDANLQQLPDQEAADRIEEMIMGLGVVAKFSFYFSQEAVEEFYGGGPRESMVKELPKNPEEHENRWTEFVEFMASGPTTALILYSPDGDAIQLWREHLGHWNIDEVRDEATIRGSLGVNKYNNLVHGSDSIESVVRETGLIRKTLRKQVEGDVE